MPEEENEYAQDIHIDEQALDVEWLAQPELMLKYCIVAAQAHRRADLAKARVDVVAAQLNRAIRSDPSLFNINRITSEVVLATIETDTEYQESVKKAINARYEHEMALAAVKAMENRKSALENLVRLHGQAYFAGPSIPRNLAEARRQRDTSIQQRVRITRRT
jgi:hypothetical protein